MAKYAHQISLPALRENNVVRTACLNRLEQGPQFPIVALIAGAGAGKTTLLRQIYDRLNDQPIDRIWIGLDDGKYSYDDMWNLLLDHLTVSGVFNDTNHIKYSIDVDNDDPRQRVNFLCEYIAKKFDKLALFFDDFHFFSSKHSLQFFDYLFLYQPENLQIYFASRTYPDIALNKLKIKNKLMEFSWDDLSFSRSETECFFTSDGQPLLPETMTEHIHDMTRGWAVGLQLALMQSRLDSSIQKNSSVPFYSDDIQEYFESEILSSFDKHIIDILLCTSILDRFNDDLAAYVADINRSDTAKYFRYLHDHSFPIIHLDGSGGWKKYHGLIRDILSSIRDNEGRFTNISLCGKASMWWEQQGSISEAIEYAIRGQDYERASLLVESHALDLFSYGAAPELARWLRRIPNKIIVQRPQLPLLLCLMLLHTQEPIEVVKLHYDKAKQTIATLEAIDYFDTQDQHSALLAELKVTDTLTKFIAGDMANVIESAHKFLSEDRGARPIFVAVLYNIAGYAHFAIGQNNLARTSLKNGKQLHIAADCVFGVVFSEAFLGMVDYAEGLTASSLEHFRIGLQYAQSELGDNDPTTSTARLYVFLLKYETNEHDGGAEELGQILHNCRKCSHPEIYASALLIHSELCRNEGKIEESESRLVEALRFGQECGNDLICLEALYAALLVAIDKGDVSAATANFAQAQDLWKDLDQDFTNQWDRKVFWRAMFHAEIYQLTAQPSKAVAVYEQLITLTSFGNRVRRKILILTKYAMALASSGDEKRAMEEIFNALKLAKKSRIIRPILNAGQRTNKLIERCYAHTDELEMRVFLEDSFSFSSEKTNLSLSINDAEDSLVIEELTDKEIQILKLLTTGAKNKEICVQLGLAENTVKWYLKRIYEKLCVDNRTEAALVAKSLFTG